MRPGETKRTSKVDTVSFNIRFIKPVLRALKVKAAQEETSVSFLIHEAVLPLIGMTQEHLEKITGRKLPKRFSERKAQREQGSAETVMVGVECICGATGLAPEHTAPADGKLDWCRKCNPKLFDEEKGG